MGEDERQVSIPLAEQETSINFSRDGAECYIWTSDTTVMTKLDKLCETAPDNYRVRRIGKVKGCIVDKDYVITDKSLLSFKPRKRVMNLSDEERANYAQRFKKKET